MQSIKLNLIPGAVLPVVNVSQYDVKRTFALAVYDGAASYDLTGKTVTIRGTKPDNHGFDYGTSDGVISVSGNTVTVSTTQQMTAVGGQVMAELRIESGTTIIGTLNFIIDVEPSALSDDTILSDTEIPVIERNFEAALAEAEADALVAEGYAKGTQEGTPVGAGSPYYQDNAKYYKEEAEAAASGVLEKYPKIVSDYWYIWDVDTNQYVNTGVRAKGTQGDPGQGVPAGGTTGQVLKKKSNSDYDCEWGTGGGGADALDDLTDVSITSAADGDLLQYNGTSGEWENNSEIPNAVSALEETGAVNLLPNDATTQTIEGATFTVNSDTTITINRASATANAALINITKGGNITETRESGTYYLSGVPSGSSGLTIQYYDVTDNISWNDSGNGATITVVKGHTVKVTARVAPNKTLSNVTIKPMIALKPNMPYSPYAMTNRELTEEKCDKNVIGYVEDGTTSAHAYGPGQHFVRKNQYCAAISAIAVGDTLMEGTNFVTGFVSDLAYVSNLTFNGNCNDLQPSLVYYGNAGSNAPFNWCIIQTLYANLSGSNRVQIAYGCIASKISTRYYAGGTWSTWTSLIG